MRHAREEMRQSMRLSANNTRDVADEMARSLDGCDDPMHPDLTWPQDFTSWVDFVDRCARPLVEALEGDDAASRAEVQKHMQAFRRQSPYSLCVSLVMAANRLKEARA